jgi:DNA excision repair protein ERCC-2
LHHEILKQAPAMQLTQTHEILEAFKKRSFALLGVVLGGVLAESIDFLESSIDGIFVVSLGLPPPSLERDLMAERFKGTRDYEWGQTAAYRQPALNKVLQVCGRLIRSPSHRGMLYLIDPRYASARIQSFFPSHWDPVMCQSSEVSKLTRQFWNSTE